MRLVFATNNANKIAEVSAMLDKRFELLSLADIGCSADIPETAGTFSGNALQKAGYVREHYGLDCFADDTGLEVKALDWEIGSICGGGRYDDLTGIFGLPGTSGVGISFGADRIYDVLGGLNLFPSGAIQGTKVLFSNMGREEMLYTIALVEKLRKEGTACEIYPESAKMRKQIDYAVKKNIPYFVIIGGDEMASGNVMLKNLATGEQVQVPVAELSGKLK